MRCESWTFIWHPKVTTQSFLLISLGLPLEGGAKVFRSALRGQAEPPKSGIQRAMSDLEMHLFDTPLGTCGLAWGPRGLVAVQLPEANDDDVFARLQVHAPGAINADPPAWVRALIDAMRRHFKGESVRYDDVRLDLDRVPPFHRAIYVAARSVGPGFTVGYGELAKRIGSAGAARAVGQAMARNPWPVVVPCHRVLASGAKAGGFSSYGGIVTKARLLELERVRLEGTFQPSLTPRMGAADFDAAAATRALSERDPKLGALIAKVGAFTLKRDEVASVYEALARAVVFQQLSGKAAETIYGRVVALSTSGALPSPAEMLALDTAALRGAGLSNSKLLALRDLAAKTLSGPFRRSRRPRGSTTRRSSSGSPRCAAWGVGPSRCSSCFASEGPT